MCFYMRRCVSKCEDVLSCTAMFLRCIAMFTNVWLCDYALLYGATFEDVLLCLTKCEDVLQCVRMCCRVLLCVKMCCYM
jgi:hypothetical protein